MQSNQYTKYNDIGSLYEDLKDSLDLKLESMGEKKLDEEYVSIFNRNYINEDKHDDNICTPRSI